MRVQLGLAMDKDDSKDVSRFIPLESINLPS